MSNHNNIKTLHLAFGIPGTGKTTLFTQLAKENKNKKIGNKVNSNLVIFEANKYPDLYTVKKEEVNENGEKKNKKYLFFNATKLGLAHKWCKENVEKSMINGLENIYQSNTNLNPCDMIDYLVLANKYNYIINIHIPEKDQFLQYKTNKSMQEQINQFKIVRSKKYYNITNNNEKMEKFIPSEVLDKMIDTFKINGEKLRSIKKFLIQKNKEFNPNEWLNQIISKFSCSYQITNLISLLSKMNTSIFINS